MKLAASSGKVTIVFLGFGPNESTAAASHFFKRTFTVGTKSAQKSGYSATSRPS